MKTPGDLLTASVRETVWARARFARKLANVFEKNEERKEE